jgi:hypothetical protein
LAKGGNPLCDLSEKRHKAARAKLIQASSAMGKRRLTSVCQKHAGAWTLGPGQCTPLPSVHFRAGLHWYLGLTVCPSTHVCECGRASDSHGVHFTQCRLLDRRTQCHNQLRDVVAQTVRDAGMSVQIEACAPGERTRPGDILIPGWRKGKTLAVDFAIVTAHNAAEPDLTANKKHLKYDEACTNAGWEFTAAVADSHGAILGEGHRFLAALNKLRAEKIGKGYPAPQEVFWRTISTAVAWRAAGAIAAAWARGATPDPGGREPGPHTPQNSNHNTSAHTPSPSLPLPPQKALLAPPPLSRRPPLSPPFLLPPSPPALLPHPPIPIKKPSCRRHRW